MPDAFDEFVLIVDPDSGETLDAIGAQAAETPVDLAAIGDPTVIPISK
ncbi:hypothetical protein QT381_05220 [Galbitalea sp. SE-J8]|nr:hypothetical protein [Galbitalea sp. SE-J8]MDM4762405.1 hypothetical protein [Galbitalea sp. SE-J8]